MMLPRRTASPCPASSGAASRRAAAAALSALLLAAAPTAAQSSLPTGTKDFQKSGTTGFALLELPLALRSAGRADTRTLTLDGADALFANPAGIGWQRERPTALSASSTRYLAGTHLSTAAVARQFGGAGTFGASVAVLDYGQMRRTVNAGTTSDGRYTEDGTFGANALVAGLTYARQMTDRFAFGATAKYVREAIAEYDASALAVDLGMSFQTPLSGLKIGGVMQNFGREARFIGNPFRLPTTIRLGAAYEVLPAARGLGRLTTVAEFMHPNNGVEELRLAGEYAPLPAFTVRAGYAVGVGSGGATALDTEGLSLGATVALPSDRLGLDAAYMRFGELGTTFGLALRARL